MKKPIKGLLFDRENSRISEIRISGYKDVQNALFMTSHDGEDGRFVTLTVVTFELNGARVTAYVDDEGNDTDVPTGAFEGMAKDGLPYVVAIDGIISYR